MSRIQFRATCTLACLFLAGVRSVWAGCTTITFDDLSAGTVVTNQYPGVTFSGWNPEGDPAVDPVIYNPNGSTTSEPQCLSASGSVDFSHEFIRIDFDRDQTEVTFTLGVRTGCTETDRVAVRYYEYVNNAYTYRGTFTPYVNGTLPNERVLVFVRVTRPNNQLFRRIEIEGNLAYGCGDRYELIDDLSFDIDTTAPVADITSPDPLGCVCNGSDVIGSAYDPDGGITNYRLERKAPSASTWTLIRSSSTEVVNGTLATWTTSATSGWYTLRLKVTNECDLTAEDETVVWLDKSFDDVELRAPAAGAILGGTVCADGTAWDHCGGTFTLEHRPVAGAFAPFNPIYPPWIRNDPLGSWNTLVGTPDGAYEVRLAATDDCSNTASSPVVPVTIDNTAPVAVISQPSPCTAADGVITVRGTASDANLQNWTLYYTGGAAAGWVQLATGNASVVNGVLKEWNVSALLACCYTLRLVATDQANVNCTGLPHQTEYLVSLDIGAPEPCEGDVDGDGDVDLADLSELLSVYGSQCP